MNGAADITRAIASADFSSCAATVIGYGAMGRQYVAALRALKVPRIRVCSRSAGPLAELNGVAGVETIAGGYRNIGRRLINGELAIIATPIDELVPAASFLRERGYERLLIEKPIALDSTALTRFAETLGEVAAVVCAYNRVAYPALLEARSRADADGGITSATYTFTEFTRRIHRGDYPEMVLERWGIANSLHVVSMAHALIGWPKQWTTFRAGRAVDWHPTGSVFVGAGSSARGIPYAYHADWGSTGRWSVEVHTRQHAYRLCPLEALQRRSSATGAWEEVPVQVFAPEVKPGFVEQVAAMLQPAVREMIPLVSLRDAVELVRYGEDIFGYGRGHYG